MAFTVLKCQCMGCLTLQLRGMYTARQLSFMGVTFSIHEVALTEKFIRMYDSSVEMVISTT